jgi:23S rRNA pseudouridine1911/1915/1917 synthase
MTPEILYKSHNAIVIYKPPMMPSQSDTSGDKDALTLTSEQLKAMGEREELYLINRLDRVVSGLMIFARNKSYAQKLSAILSEDSFSKEYFAIIDGVVESGEMVDWLAKDSIVGKAVVCKAGDKGAKEAVLDLELLETVAYKGKEKSLVHVKLKTGRFHQIRAQLSSRGAPLTGDKKYGSHDFGTRQPSLFAYHLSAFVDGEKIEAKRLPDTDKYPWSLFSAEQYQEKMEGK